MIMRVSKYTPEAKEKDQHSKPAQIARQGRSKTGTSGPGKGRQAIENTKSSQLKQIIAGRRAKMTAEQLAPDPHQPEYADAIPGQHHKSGIKGRGAALNPGNRFEGIRLHVLGETMDYDAGLTGQADARREKKQTNVILPDTERYSSDAHGGTIDQFDAEAACATGSNPGTRLMTDKTRTFINPVDSTDLPMNWTANPYRGCEHGCIYCYARPTHEYIGMSSGLDFESKIMVKRDAPALFKAELSKPSWKGEPIAFSGVTDCYQPAEATEKVTRACLEIAAKAHQPVGIVTKSRMILRDLDMLKQLNDYNAVHVAISLTTLDNQLAAKLEPRASSPRDRLWTIKRLSEAGIPVMVMVAPIIPGLNDWEIPNLLKAASDHGATSAGKVMLRLPYQVERLFVDWLDRHYPERKSKVLSLIREMRAGKLNSIVSGERMTGVGPIADQIHETFHVFARRHGLDSAPPVLNSVDFIRPVDDHQLGLFG